MVRNPTIEQCMKTVCVVDDERGVQQWVAHCIGQVPGFPVAGIFGSGEDALAQIPRLQPDIVVMDQRMPGMSGLECGRKLRESLTGLKLLFMTGYPDEDLVRGAVHLGAASFLMKPFRKEQLLEALQVVAEGDIYLSASLEPFLSGDAVPPERASPSSLLGRLTPREAEVLRLNGQGMPYKQIAEALRIRCKTVDATLQHARKKLGAHSNLETLSKLGWTSGGITKK